MDELTLEELCNLAMETLPPGYRVVLTMEAEGAHVSLWKPDGKPFNELVTVIEVGPEAAIRQALDIAACLGKEGTL